VFYLYPKFTSDSIHGDLIDAAMYQDKDGKPMIWILTDGSFHYISETKTAGSHSIETKGFFCKTYNYLYDPNQAKILSSIKTDYDNLPDTYTKVYFVKGNIWQISRGNSKNEHIIEIFDANTGGMIMGTESFISKHPKLKGGITDLSVKEVPLCLEIKTSDGMEFKYYVDVDTLMSMKNFDYREEHNFLKNSYNAITNCFVMGYDNNEVERKSVYLLRANEFMLFDYFKREANIASYEINNFAKDKAYNFRADIENVNIKIEIENPKLLTPDKVYLNGIIIYQDQDAAVILHQDKLGKNNDRMLTCVDADGNEKWTALPENFPEKMKQRESDSFSDLFFMKDKFSGMRSGNIFVFKFKEFGFIGFDFESGKKLWTIKI
jgi:hypothetical protein